MSATLATPTAPPAWRRVRARVLWLALIVAFGIVSSVLLWPPLHQPLDPDSAAGDGTLAVVRVLEGRGVGVRTVKSGQALARASETLAGEATLVVSASDAWSPRTEDALIAALPSFRHVVFVGVAGAQVESLGVDVRDVPASRMAKELTRQCSSDVPGRATTIDVPGTVYVSSEAAQGCFPSGSGYALLMLESQVDGPDIDLISATDVFMNRTILRADHAALALRLLSRDPTLVWYLPGADDAVDTEPDVTRTPPASTLLPPWADAAEILALIVVAALMVARGRRLGRLVVEPLPVVVRAIETVQSRGRLYRRAGDTAHATAILTGATRERLREALALPRDSSPDQIVAAVARASGREPREVHSLLYDSAPTTDTAFVARAQDLAALEQEVRHP